MSHITDKLHHKKWGVFNHYLYHDRDKGPGAWNQNVSALDVKDLARRLHEMNAGYYFITLMQGDRFMLAPNATYDAIVGSKPGEACAERDLPMELADELEKYGIDLYLYYTGDGPYKDDNAGKAFGFYEPRDKIGGSEAFVSKWAAVLGEYAKRYGSKVKGYWIDGCYEGFQYTDELLDLYRDAIKAGNPEALVSMNNGVFPECRKYYRNEDFTCGEFNDFEYIPESRFIDGSQAHILAPLGKPAIPGNPWTGWCQPGLKRSKEYMAQYIRDLNRVGGVLTVDIFIDRDGHYDSEQMEAMTYIGKQIER